MQDRDPKSISLLAGVPGLSDELFPKLLIGTVRGLHKLLHRSVDNWNDPIGKLGKLALNCDEPWQRFSRDWESKRLGLLASDARLLAAKNPELFRGFRRSYRKLSFNQFFGWRHELRVAADLTSRGIAFRKREAPDFQIEALNSPVFLECGSANLTAPKDKDVSYKLAAVVAEKATKPYANKRTALFVDYSNVLFSSALGAQVLSAELANSTLESAFADSSFGAIVGTAMVVDVIDDRFKMVGMTKIAPDASSDLAAFVAQYAPSGPAQWVAYIPTFSI